MFLKCEFKPPLPKLPTLHLSILVCVFHDTFLVSAPGFFSLYNSEMSLMVFRTKKYHQGRQMVPSYAHLPGMVNAVQREQIFSPSF